DNPASVTLVVASRPGLDGSRNLEQGPDATCCRAGPASLCSWSWLLCAMAVCCLRHWGFYANSLGDATDRTGTCSLWRRIADDAWSCRGWGGGGSGGDGCTITVHADATIWATFEAKAPPPTCRTGTYPCGAGHCTPNGDVCCASAGHEELYCPPAYTCTTDG